MRGCTFSLARKYQRAPGGAELSLLRSAPGPPYPSWGSSPNGVAPPSSTRGRPGTLWSTKRLWAPIARHWLALCARVCCSGGRGGCWLGGVCGVRAIADRPYRGAQESSLIRVAAQPYLRRDPYSETTQQRHPRMGFERAERPFVGCRGKAPAGFPKGSALG